MKKIHTNNEESNEFIYIEPIDENPKKRKLTEEMEKVLDYNPRTKYNFRIRGAFRQLVSKPEIKRRFLLCTKGCHARRRNQQSSNTR